MKGARCCCRERQEMRLAPFVCRGDICQIQSPNHSTCQTARSSSSSAQRSMHPVFLLRSTSTSYTSGSRAAAAAFVWGSAAAARRAMSNGGDEPQWGSNKMRLLAETLRQFKPPEGRFGNLLRLPPPAGVEVKPGATGFPKDLEDQFPWSKRAAVLLCLFVDRNEELKVILTKRTSTLSTHSGEVALPGGKRDPEDADDVETALREAEEEIGLDRKLVRVVSQLEPFVTRFMVRILPVMALLPRRTDFVPRINPAEVESLFEAPLEMFLKDENHDAKQEVVYGVPVLIHSFNFEYGEQRYRIWGATAAILIRAASIVYAREPEFSCSLSGSKI